MTTSDLRAAAQAIRDGSKFLVAGHVNPDGDSVGSMCALSLALRGRGKSVLAVLPDGIPDAYRFLPDSGKIVTQVPEDEQFDAALVVDCESLSRLGTVEPVLSRAKKVIDVDHHPGGERTSEILIVDPTAAATGELVYCLLREMDIKITPQIAECLLTAIVTDTGSFRFSNVTPRTLRIAADLIEAGGAVSKIVRKVYETRSITHAKLLGAALSSLQTTFDGRIAYACITRAQSAAAQGSGAESEGIVNYLRSIRGAHVGILFREEANGSVRVSLRSGNSRDISQIARLFGGGGHRTAAGCTIERPLPEAVEMLLDAVQKWMAY